MAGNSFRQAFRITTFGELHGGALGCVVDGCPSGIAISETDIQKELDCRRPGQSHITSPRREEDVIHIFSSVFEGKTTRTPILLMIYSIDMRPKDYDHLKSVCRPLHADFTYLAKYDARDPRGSGRASARETLARVAAGVIAKKLLKETLGIKILSYVEQVGDIKTDFDYRSVTPEAIEANIMRCPDPEIAEKMIALIEEVKAYHDSIGGVVKGVIKGVPPGLGEPVFDKIPMELGKAMLSINAVKGFEFGSGFAGVSMQGSSHNDEFFMDKKAGRARTRTNNAGGTLGGITTEEDIYFRVIFKPVATIGKKQKTINVDNQEVELEAAGRHDPCVLPRAVPIVDAMAALVVIDHYLRHRVQNG